MTAGTSEERHGAPGPRLAELFPESAEVGDALRRTGRTVALAESCTGGLLSAVLTAVPGASDYVRGGVVAYADDVKRSLLDVPAETLALYGAVSRECAVAMATAARRRLVADIGVSITGVAGPGSDHRPPGLIFVAVAGPDEGAVRVDRLDGDRGREANRAVAVATALRMCRDVLG